METNKRKTLEILNQFIKAPHLNKKKRVSGNLYSKDSTIVIPIYKLRINKKKIEKRLFEICLCHGIVFIKAIIVEGIKYPNTWITARIIDERLQIYINIKLRSSQMLLTSIPTGY